SSKGSRRSGKPRTGSQAARAREALARPEPQVRPVPPANPIARRASPSTLRRANARRCRRRVTTPKPRGTRAWAHTKVARATPPQRAPRPHAYAKPRRRWPGERGEDVGALRGRRGARVHRLRPSNGGAVGRACHRPSRGAALRRREEALPEGRV